MKNQAPYISYTLSPSWNPGGLGTKVRLDPLDFLATFENQRLDWEGEPRFSMWEKPPITPFGNDVNDGYW